MNNFRERMTERGNALAKYALSNLEKQKLREASRWFGLSLTVFMGLFSTVTNSQELLWWLLLLIQKSIWLTNSSGADSSPAAIFGITCLRSSSYLNLNNYALFYNKIHTYKPRNNTCYKLTKYIVLCFNHQKSDVFSFVLYHCIKV